MPENGVEDQSAANPTGARSLGFLGATGVGVGAIVGGGILALAGVAYATTGPGALVAFALNGLIALITALSFAEMASAFPESGGTYTFSKKVLTVQAAFMVGWVVWFASIVAGVLYALGFAHYALILVEELWAALFGAAPAWLVDRKVVTILAVGATAVYTLDLIRRTAGGGQWATVGKVIVFGVIILGGVWALGGRPVREIGSGLSPFFPGGITGLITAMGYTFIALQGFDLIAAVGGEIRNPGRTIPRAMFASLGIALGIYLPFLFIVATVGVPPAGSITSISEANPETVVAHAVENFLGTPGFWLVIVAAILSMLSALQANLFAASRVAMAMARDRTLPSRFGIVDDRRGTPVTAVLITSLTVAVILLLITEVSAAGAVSSLIFLISFALAHYTSILARQRSGERRTPFRVPWFPLFPTVGGLACLALAVFQAFAVPAAGLVAGVWLGLGGILYLTLFARRARIVDASAEAVDPHLVKLRGRSPLVLVPIANPAHAEAMVAVANALAPPQVGRVLLLSVVSAPAQWEPGEPPPQLLDAQAVLRETLTASFAAGLAPEALTTIAPRPWAEIGRVARIHRCESLLVGLTKITEKTAGPQIEELMSSVGCDVVVLRTVPGWRLSQVRRVLVPLGGSGGHDALRARLLGSLTRTGVREITYLRVVAEGTSREALERARRGLSRVAQDDGMPRSRIEIVQSAAPTDEVTRHAAESDLVVLGLKRFSRRHKVLGEFAVKIARKTACGIIMISRRG